MRPIGLVALALSLSAGGAGLVAAQEATVPAVTAKPAIASPTAPASAPASPSTAPPSAASPAAVPVATSAAAPDETAPKSPEAAKAPEPPKPPPEPLKRPRFNAAILQGVDKITAETLRFEVKVGQPVRYKGLILTVHACETTAADEAITDSIAHVDVQSQPEVLPGRVAAAPRQVFRGWMFASSPTLHPFEHPIYDLWLIACKTAAPGV